MKKNCGLGLNQARPKGEMRVPANAIPRRPRHSSHPHLGGEDGPPVRPVRHHVVKQPRAQQHEQRVPQADHCDVERAVEVGAILAHGGVAAASNLLEAEEQATDSWVASQPLCQSMSDGWLVETSAIHDRRITCCTL